MRWCRSIIPLQLGWYAALNYSLIFFFVNKSLKTSKRKDIPLSTNTIFYWPPFHKNLLDNTSSAISFLIFHHIATLPGSQSIKVKLWLMLIMRGINSQLSPIFFSACNSPILYLGSAGSIDRHSLHCSTTSCIVMCEFTFLAR